MLLSAYTIRTLIPAHVLDHEAGFLSIAADVPGEYWTRDHFLIDLPEKWRLSFAVWDEDRPIAYAILSKKAPAQVHLHHFMVAASYRGKSIGSHMVSEMERRVRKVGCSQLTLKVAADNLAAQRFYIHHGFSQESRDGSYLNFSKAL